MKRKKNPGRRELLDAPRAEEPRRIRGQERAAVEQSRRDLLGRTQSPQALQVRPRAFWPPPSAAAEDLAQLDAAVQQAQRAACSEAVEHEPGAIDA